MRTKFSRTVLSVGFALALAFTFSCSSNNISDGGGTLVGDRGTFIDERGGNMVYRWVKIGEQIWMAENLNYKAEGAKCYGEGGQVELYDEINDVSITITLSDDEVQANCRKYGRLYDWVTAMALPSNCDSTSCASQIKPKHQGICPSGWHISSSYDWQKLVEFIGDRNTAGKKLRATSGWKPYWVDEEEEYKDGNGTDNYGFSALPGGRGWGWSYDGRFNDVGKVGYWWTTSERAAANALSFKMRNNYDDVNGDGNGKSALYSVRCLHD